MACKGPCYHVIRNSYPVDQVLPGLPKDGKTPILICSKAVIPGTGSYSGFQ